MSLKMSLATHLKQKGILSALFLTLLSFLPVRHSPAANAKQRELNVVSVQQNCQQQFQGLYDSLSLQTLGLCHEAFAAAIQGFKIMQASGILKNQRVLTIADLTQPSSRKRLFVIDLEKGKLLFQTLVAHGRNSGDANATRFSNSPNSFQSSLGFYVTGDTYRGQHGYSLRLLGMEPGINDNAYSRGIVVHAAGYVNPSLANARGYIGRSEGCPAVPVKIHKALISTIRNGSCLFMYGRDDNYPLRSKFLASVEG